MKKHYIFPFIIVLLICTMSSCEAKKARQAAQEAREKFVLDSIARDRFIQDSITRRKTFVLDSIAKREKYVADSINEAKKKKDIARLSKLFRTRYDEFEECTWVTPYSSPRNRGANAVYCYFATIDGEAYNFRFVFQYYSDHWLFIDELVFSIDGEAYSVTPNKWLHDVGDGVVAEWCDESVHYKNNSDSGMDEELITAIVNANTIKIQMRGSSRYDIRTLNAAQKQSIKDTYEYYKLLGGTFGTYHNKY